MRAWTDYLDRLLATAGLDRLSGAADWSCDDKQPSAEWEMRALRAIGGLRNPARRAI